MRAMVLAAFAGAAMAGGCRPEEEPRFPPREEVIEHISRPLEEQQYSVTLRGTIELPEWGVIDGATFVVDEFGDLHAGVMRVDDGAYGLYRQSGQTFFKREGCTQYARVAGGGADVLAPFVLADEIRTATDLRYPVYAQNPQMKLAAPSIESPPAPPSIRARLAHLGEVRIADATGVRRIEGETFVMDVAYVFERVLPLNEPIVPELGDRAPRPDVC